MNISGFYVNMRRALRQVVRLKTSIIERELMKRRTRWGPSAISHDDDGRDRRG